MFYLYYLQEMCCRFSICTLNFRQYTEQSGNAAKSCRSLCVKSFHVSKQKPSPTNTHKHALLHGCVRVTHTTHTTHTHTHSASAHMLTLLE